MLECFYASPATLRRHRQGPLGAHVDAFAQSLQERGHPRSTVRHMLISVAHLSDWMRCKHLSAVGLRRELVERFVRHDPRVRRFRHHARTAVRKLLAHLQEVGVVPPEAPPKAAPIERVLGAFEEYLVGERGLSKRAAHSLLQDLGCFLAERYGQGEIRLARLRPQDPISFIARRSRTLSSSSAKRITWALRSFLRYLHLQGKTRTNLSGCVPSVPCRRLAGLPRHIEPKEVRRLLASCDRRSPAGLRDYAILLLLARLGLRSCEVVALTLDDVDWRQGTITIRGKGSEDRFGLARDVGAAIARYLVHGRPLCATRRIFVPAYAPRRESLGATNLACIVRAALKRAGLNPPCKGAHILRHSLAVRLLRRKSTLFEIGQILRHRHPDTTALYAKVDFNRLRRLARPWPGGVR